MEPDRVFNVVGKGADAMLVLSRKHGERIQIGDDIVVQVVKIRPHVVRIGIEAPQELNIARSELIDDGTREPERESVAA